LVNLYPDPITKQKTITTNAVYVDGYEQKRQFIVTQVPQNTTRKQFWCMVKQNKVEQIYVLNEPARDEVILNILQCQNPVDNSYMFPGGVFAYQKQGIFRF